MQISRRKYFLMSALGVALSAGAAAVAAAFDASEKFVVTGALQVTHTITEQVCHFDTLEQLEGYLAAVADRHHWFRHDQEQPASTDLLLVNGTTQELIAEPIAATAVAVDVAVGEDARRAAAVAAMQATEPAVPAPIVSVDLGQLRAELKADIAAEDAAAGTLNSAADIAGTDSAVFLAASSTDQADQAAEQPAADPAAQ